MGKVRDIYLLNELQTAGNYLFYTIITHMIAGSQILHNR